MNFDAQLVDLMLRVHRLQRLSVADDAGRQQALQESLEALRAVTRYRALLKNVTEVQSIAQLRCG